MKLLLQTNVENLGEIGEVVEVSDGYGRNYLLPQRLAIANTPENRRRLQAEKLLAIQREAKRQELAKHVAKNLKNALLQVKMKAQDDGSLYGSVTPSIIVDVIEEAKGYRVEERWVQLDRPIKRAGDYDVSLRAGEDLECTFKLSVYPE